MTGEALLAWTHILAFLALAVFLSCEAALCHQEWMNEAVVRRLARLDILYGISAALVLASGLARVFWGVKGAGWYGHNPLLWTKIGVLVVMAVLAIHPTRAFLRWCRALDAGGALPPPEEIRRARLFVMWQAHLLPLIPLAAVFMARGYGG